MGNKGVKDQETKRVREVIADHDLTLLFRIVDRRPIEAALLDAYRRGVEDGTRPAS